MSLYSNIETTISAKNFIFYILLNKYAKLILSKNNNNNNNNNNTNNNNNNNNNNIINNNNNNNNNLCLLTRNKNNFEDDTNLLYMININKKTNYILKCFYLYVSSSRTWQNIEPHKFIKSLLKNPSEAKNIKKINIPAMSNWINKYCNGLKFKNATFFIYESNLHDVNFIPILELLMKDQLKKIDLSSYMSEKDFSILDIMFQSVPKYFKSNEKCQYYDGGDDIIDIKDFENDIKNIININYIREIKKFKPRVQRLINKLYETKYDKCNTSTKKKLKLLGGDLVRNVNIDGEEYEKVIKDSQLDYKTYLYLSHIVYQINDTDIFVRNFEYLSKEFDKLINAQAKKK